MHRRMLLVVAAISAMHVSSSAHSARAERTVHDESGRERTRPVALRGTNPACTPGYDPCIPPGPDVDCAGGRGDGPRYVEGPVQVTGSDPYGLDRDRNGIGCE